MSEDARLPLSPIPEDALLIRRDGAVLELLINRPEQRNALSLALLSGIGAALDAHAGDESLRCAMITAAGDRCFAAGGDLKELDAVRSIPQARAMSRHGRSALDRVRSFPVPVIAALNGHALGGGAELAMACDFRLMVPQARIGFLQASLAVTTAWGGGIDLVHALGSARALELLLGARQVEAQEALRIGLVHAVARPGQSLAEAVSEFISPLLPRPRQVAVAATALAREARRQLHARLAEAEEHEFVATWTHADHWAAVDRAAAARKRPA